MFKRFTALLLAVIMTVMFIGCNPTTTPPDDTTDDVTTEAPAQPIDISAEALSEYKVIRPSTDNGNSYDVTIAAAIKLRKTINDAFGIEMGIGDDWIKNTADIPATAKEILVGPTNRTESANALELIRSKDFVITFENERIVIVGGTEDATSRAVDYFIETYVDIENKKLALMEKLVDINEFEYPLGSISINGTSIADYVVVYPEDCDLVTYYTAVAFSDYISNNGGITLEVVSDKTAETQYEILVGDTNRAASNTGVTLTNEQFSLSVSDDKVVMLGDHHMVAAAASTFIHTYAGSGEDVDITTIPTTATASTFTFKEATSAITMIGDGMSALHFQSAIDTGVIDEFVADFLPYKGEATTFSQSVTNGSASYTDSAASATALSSGYKTLNAYLGVTPAKVSKQNIRELAHSTGAKTAVVTTDKITGATPAGFLCHHTDRDGTAVLQSQIDKLINDNLVDYTYGAGSNNKVDLTAYAREALNLISENNSSFFIMIEEAYIDKNSHNNDLSKTTTSVKIYNDVIAYCIAFTYIQADTLLVITADHDCGNLVKKASGEYVYTSTNHTNKNVPVFAVGDGAEELISKSVIDNTDIPKQMAKIFGDNNFNS